MNYALRTNDIVLVEEVPTIPAPKSYVLKIHDLPPEDKPREKLLASGPGALTTAELIAVLLNTGTKKEDVLSMATRVMREYGERTLLQQTDPHTLAETLNIPLIKALQIVACGELGRRFFHRKEGGIAVLRSPKDVFDHVRNMHNLPKEHLRGLYLNMYYQIIHDEVLSIGTVTTNLVHPREVLKPAIEYNAVAIILVHNHPSGVVTPSSGDIEVTRQLISASKIIGISLLDHIIVTKNSFASIDVDYD